MRKNKFLRERDEIWERLTTKLVTVVAGSSVDDEENLQVAIQFSLSNFKQHTFAEFDPKKTLRDFQELQETFTVHSLENVAKRLQRLGELGEASLSVQFPPILQTLMLLARSPLEQIWYKLPELLSSRLDECDRSLNASELQQEASRERDARVVAWNQQVKDNGDEEEEEWLRQFKASANSDSDFSSDDEFADQLRKNENDAAEYTRLEQAEKAERRRRKETEGGRESKKRGDGNDAKFKQESITNYIAREPKTFIKDQSYNSEYITTQPNTLISALREEWRNHDRRQGREYPYHVVNESFVVREALSSMLGHNGDLFLWVESNDEKNSEKWEQKFVLNTNICLSHLSPACLADLVKPISIIATEVARARKFCNVHTDPSKRSCSGGTVWQAYVAGVSNILLQYEKEVGKEIQRYLNYDRKNRTNDRHSSDSNDGIRNGLLSLRSWLSHQDAIVSLLQELTNKNVPLPNEKLAMIGKEMEDDKHDHNAGMPSQRVHVCHIINMVTELLSKSLLSQNLIRSKYLWVLFNQLIVPYSNLFGPFIDFGLLQDPYQELFIVRTRPQEEDDHPTDSAYTSTTAAAVTTTATTIGGASASSLRSTDHGWHDLFVLDLKAIPIIFQSFSQKMLLIGKTQYFRTKIESLSFGKSKWPIVVSNISKQSILLNEPLLVCSERILIEPIESSLHSTSQSMMNLLINVLGLDKHLKRMQEIYMLSNIDMMEGFISSMFNYISSSRRRRGDTKKSVDENVAVTYWLRRSMASYGNNISTSTTTSTTRRNKPKFFIKESEEVLLSRWSASFRSLSNMDDSAAVNVLNELTVNYSAPWPINIVIDHDALEKYNIILRWLLQVKRCKSQLDQLHTKLRRIVRSVRKQTKKILYKDRDIEAKLHKCSLILMEFLHFINNVHSYMMDCAVRSEWDQFQEELKEQENKNIEKNEKNGEKNHGSFSSFMSIDDVRHRHTILLNSIMEQCLLNDRNHVARSQVVKILNFSHRASQSIHEYIRFATEKVQFTTEQDQPNRQIHYSMESLINVHRNFQRTVRFLIVLMKSHIRNSHNSTSASFASSILTTIDFSNYYGQKNYNDSRNSRK